MAQNAKQQSGKSKGGGSGPTSVERLNALLSGELAAIATYKLALDHLESQTHTRTGLEACLQSHQQRAALLRAAISERGGTPAAPPGAWPAIVQMAETELHDREALAALEDGEGHELDDYRAAVSGIEASVRSLIEQQLLPKQVQSHHAISELRKLLH
jgi:multidrug resistance efflux pump